MNVKNLSIKKKLIFLQLLVVFVVLVLSSVFHFVNDSRVYRKTISTKLASMAGMLGHNSTSALNFRDGQDAAKTLRSLEAEAQVIHAWILDASGKAFAEYARSDQRPELPPLKGGDFEEVRGRTLALSRRILQEEETIGSVLLYYDLGEYHRILLRNFLLAGLALLASMGIALMLALFTHRALTVPILNLVDIIKRVSRTKDLSVRIFEPRRDEIGVLYRGFDDMLAEIHSRETERDQAAAEIRKLNESLERRVNERTRELASANERLIELDRLKSLFLASMSHELRTPLNSILGFTGLLLMGMSGPLGDEQTKQLTMVQNSAKHLLELINDILDISKIESGKVDLLIESFSVAEVTDETLKAVTPLAEAKGLALTADVPENLVIQSDKRRVKQVLMNLLSNAIKFSEKGSVRVEVEDLDRKLMVSVSDHGIGIRPEDMEKLFIPFGQIDMSSTKQYEGTGLGLYLNKKILSLLHGTISARSEYGHGSTFAFFLPLKWKDDPHENGAHH